jgi:ribosomal protein S18 acetylase RimI-like enzyme
MAPDPRPARAGDLDRLAALERAVFPLDRISRRSFARLLETPSAAVLVVEIGSEVAGYAMVLFRRSSEVARLYSIAVGPEREGAGIGAALLAAVEAAAIARGCTILRLELRGDNERALSLYERAGFRPRGRVDGYYEDGAPALRMEKRLDGRPPRSEKKNGS